LTGRWKKNGFITGKGNYYSCHAKENNQEYFLEIAYNHPVLNNFPFGQEGFYLITGAENIPVEAFGNYSHKYVELGDKIALTPFSS